MTKMTLGLDIVARHEKLLALRLVHVVELLSAEAGAALESTGFTRSWSIARALRPGCLQRAVRMPLLHRWITCAEELIRCDAHVRYPEAHLVRHLKDFSRVLLSMAGEATDGATGEVPLLGRRVLPLQFGTALLRFEEPQRGELTWCLRDGSLRLEYPGGSMSLELDPSHATAPSARGAWHVVRVPTVRDIAIDLWTPEYGQTEPEVSAVSLQTALEAALSELEGTPSGSLATVTAVTALDTSAPWIAGLGRCSTDGAALSARSLLELAHRDRLERWLEISRFTEGRDVTSSFVTSSDVRKELVTLGARVAVASALGAPLEAIDGARWRDLIHRLSASVESEAMLSELVREVGMEETVARAGAGELERRTVTTASILAAPELSVPGSQLPSAARRLRKTRDAMQEEVDWSGIDSLCQLGTEELECLLDEVQPRNGESEGHAWCAAMTAFVIGRFEVCSQMLLSCIGFDGDVEQYWLLFGFTARHLGRHRIFEQVIFGGERHLSVLIPNPEKTEWRSK